MTQNLGYNLIKICNSQHALLKLCNRASSQVVNHVRVTPEKLG
jgi:hypothetical protein